MIAANTKKVYRYQGIPIISNMNVERDYFWVEKFNRFLQKMLHAREKQISRILNRALHQIQFWGLKNLTYFCKKKLHAGEKNKYHAL